MVLPHAIRRRPQPLSRGATVQIVAGADVLDTSPGLVNGVDEHVTANAHHREADQEGDAELASTPQHPGKNEHECQQRRRPTAARHGDGDAGKHHEGGISEQDFWQGFAASNEQVRDREGKQGNEESREMIGIHKRAAGTFDVPSRLGDPQDAIGLPDQLHHRVRRDERSGGHQDSHRPLCGFLSLEVVE